MLPLSTSPASKILPMTLPLMRRQAVLALYVMQFLLLLFIGVNFLHRDCKILLLHRKLWNGQFSFRDFQTIVRHLNMINAEA